jgi:hypothetical protein
VLGLYESVRQAFPVITEKADRIHIRQWGELDPDFAYSWFESLANALNGEMQRGADYGDHKEIFEFVGRALVGATDEIHQCIDVAFVENLFWQVPSPKCAPYWQQMPQPLRKLYLEFHSREP